MARWLSLPCLALVTVISSIACWIALRSGAAGKSERAQFANRSFARDLQSHTASRILRFPNSSHRRSYVATAQNNSHRRSYAATAQNNSRRSYVANAQDNSSRRSFFATADYALVSENKLCDNWYGQTPAASNLTISRCAARCSADSRCKGFAFNPVPTSSGAVYCIKCYDVQTLSTDSDRFDIYAKAILSTDSDRFDTYTYIKATRTSAKNMSATCKCVLHGTCASQRPKQRMDFGDQQLRFFPDKQYQRYVYDYKRYGKWHPSVRRLKKVDGTRLPHTSWNLGTEDRDGWGRHGTHVSDFVKSRVHTRCDVTGKHIIYLTYDDVLACEEPSCSRQLDFLDVADWLGMKVTGFFNTAFYLASDDDAKEDGRSSNSVANIGILQEWDRRGHVIASHSHRHKPLGHVPIEEAIEDIDLADQMLVNLSLSKKPVEHFRPGFLQLSDQVLDYLVSVKNYTVWSGYNHGGTDWAEWELPTVERLSYPKAIAQLVRNVFREEQFSVVFTLHGRPHSLRSLQDYAFQICKVCPACEFHGVQSSCS